MKKFGFIGLVVGVALVTSARDENVSVRTVGPGGGGYLVCMTASRHHPERLYVGCDVGGFYRSDDRGRNYAILNAGIENHFVYAIAEHPSETETLLIGTKGGIYKSTDGGYHWKWCRSGAKGIGPTEKFRCTWIVTQIAFCETKPNRAWAAAHASKDAAMTQIWRTDDAGETWTLLNGKDDPLGAEKKRVLTLSANSRNAEELLATTAKGLFMSIDGGANWKRIEAGLPTDGVLDFGCVGRCEAKPDVVYLSMRETVGKEGWKHPCRTEVYRSDDGGRTWAKKNVPPTNADAGKSPCPFWNEPIMAVDPQNPEVVWTGGSTFFRRSIWNTEDGGGTWKEVFHGPLGGWLQFWGNGPARPITISRSDPKFIAYGTSGTIYATEDGGKTWHQRYTKNEKVEDPFCGTGLEVTCVRFAKADRERKGRWYLGYWDLGLLISDDGGKTLRRCIKGIPGDRVNSCFIMQQSPDDGDLIWATFGDWAGKNVGSTFAVSKDRGESWSVKTNNGWCGGVTTGLACVRKGNGLVLAAATPYDWSKPQLPCGLQLSKDGGETWHDVSTNALPMAKRVTTVVANDNALYVGTAFSKGNYNGAIWRSEDGGETWVKLTPDDMMMAGPSQIAFNGEAIAVAADEPHRANDGGGCFVSRDRGKTWCKAYSAARCMGVAFVGDVLAIAMPPVRWRDPGFCGDGVMLSRDLGKTWTHAVGKGVDKPLIDSLWSSSQAPGELWGCTGGNSVIVLGIDENER